MDKDKFGEIVLKDKETRLNISRVPKRVRQEFVEYAEEEFEGDYGMLIRELWENYKMWKLFFQNMDMKLDNILERISQLKLNEESSDKENVKLLSGRRVERR